MDDEQHDHREVAFENIGAMVRSRIFDHDDGLEMCARLKAGTVKMLISAEDGCLFVDTLDGPRIEVRDPDAG